MKQTETDFDKATAAITGTFSVIVDAEAGGSWLNADDSDVYQFFTMDGRREIRPLNESIVNSFKRTRSERGQRQ
jgi:hypothetical protein